MLRQMFFGMNEPQYRHLKDRRHHRRHLCRQSNFHSIAKKMNRMVIVHKAGISFEECRSYVAPRYVSRYARGPSFLKAWKS